MRSTLIFPVILFFSVATSCVNRNNNPDNSSADILFSRSTETIIDYSSKIRNASDSSELYSLMEEFDKKITEINFSVPPETDLKITEQDNDSLIHLLNQLRIERDEKLKEFHLLYEKKNIENENDE